MYAWEGFYKRCTFPKMKIISYPLLNNPAPSLPQNKEH